MDATYLLSSLHEKQFDGVECFLAVRKFEFELNDLSIEGLEHGFEGFFKLVIINHKSGVREL